MPGDVQIAGGAGAAPQAYTVPNATEIIPRSINATFDGTGAATAFLPTVEIISDGGVVVARVPADSSVAAGGSAEVTFAPFLRNAAGVSRVEDEGTLLPQEPTLNFIGAAVSAVDNPGSQRTDVTISPSVTGDVGCRVYNSAAQSIADSTTTALSFDTDLWDTDTMHDPIGNPTQLVCVTAGKYLVGGNVYFDVNAAGYRGLQIYYSGLGGTVFGLTYLPSAGAVIGTGLNISSIVQMSVGDFLELRVRQTSGGPLNVVNFVYYSPQFWAQQIG